MTSIKPNTNTQLKQENKGSPSLLLSPRAQPIFQRLSENKSIISIILSTETCQPGHAGVKEEGQLIQIPSLPLTQGLEAMGVQSPSQDQWESRAQSSKCSWGHSILAPKEGEKP